MIPGNIMETSTIEGKSTRVVKAEYRFMSKDVKSVIITPAKSGGRDFTNDKTTYNPHISKFDSEIGEVKINEAKYDNDKLTVEIYVDKREDDARLFMRILGHVVRHSEGQQRGIIH
ncbi:hypothetical protein Ciccas_006951 [Cichlidogyrus casuarinus]|uniref:Uncharacterized protein n=1 Tax=Cichlidogyrus casuarinus TaxID=1844966 RepID=A0ABD2Q490_9PLAT